jgi:RNA polymerase primary sigma factor
VKGYAITVKKMDNKNEFQEMLGDVLEVARVQENQLGMNEIKSLFGNMNLSEAHYEQIFAYLAANHIKIKGYVETETEYTKAVLKDSQTPEEMEFNQEEEENDLENEKKQPSFEPGEDSAYLKMYLEDLKEINECTLEEESILIDKIMKGDDFAKTRYIEGNLHYVVKIAKGYSNQGVSMEDLIQEGNIGLISSLEAASELKDRKQGKEMVAGYIRKYIEAAIEEQKESISFENIMVKKINYIREAANKLGEDLGREASIHELAGYIKMPEEEIAGMLKMTADGIKLGNKHGLAEETVHTEGDGYNNDYNHGHNLNHNHKPTDHKQ